MKNPIIQILTRLCAAFVATILFFNIAFAQCPTSASVITTESRCRETGTIKITAVPAAAYTYEITAGPSLSGATTSNTFNSLGAGTYEVTISNGGCFITINAVIAGNYMDPGLLSASSDPIICPGGTSCLTMDMPSNGRTPYSYTVISGPVTRPSQTSPVFCNMPAGNYTIQALDSCGVIRTTQHSIGLDTSDFFAYAYFWETNYSTCNDMIINVHAGFNDTSSNGYRKLKIWYVNPDGDTIKAHDLRSVYDIKNDTIVGQVNAEGHWQILAYDECGRLRNSDFYWVKNNAGWIDINHVSPRCGDFGMVLYNPWRGIPAGFTIRRCSDNSVVHEPTLETIDSYWTPSFDLDYDSCYLFEMYNKCGDTIRRTASIAPTRLEIFGRGYPSCEGRTMGNIWFWYSLNTGKPPIKFTILSGPSGVGNTKVIGDNESYSEFRDLAFGTYTILGVDACGKRDTLIAQMNATMERKITITQQPHCSGGANVHLKIVTSTTNTTADDAGGTELTSVSPFYLAVNTSFTRAIDNVDAVYEADFLNVTANKLNFALNDWNNCAIDTVVDIKSYIAPTLNNVSGYVCNASSTGTINYNTLGGLAPFRYRIRPDSTGIWSAWQSNAIFNGISPGSYDVNVEDGCPNGSIRSLTFYTWEKSDIDFSSPCADDGKSLTISADNKVFGVNYQWYLNNVLVANGDSYTIPSFSTAYQGEYKLLQTFQGGQCVDSAKRYLVKCSILPLSFGELKGSNENKKAKLSWNTFKDVANIDFIVERSSDAVNYKKIGTVNSKANSNGSVYTFNDNNPLTTAFYRIKYAGFDSKTFHSNIVRISKNDLVADPVTISPVPFKTWVTIKVKSEGKGRGSIKFYNMAGAVVIKKTVELNKGNNIFWVDDELSNLPSGPYIVEVSSDGFLQRLKAIKQ